MSAFEPRRLFSFLFVLAIAVVFVLQFGPGSRGCDAPLTPSVSTAADQRLRFRIALRKLPTDGNLAAPAVGEFTFTANWGRERTQ